MRSASFANAFAFVALHMWGQGYAAWAWVLLALQFLVYPHLVYLRARRARDSQRAELHNLVLDCFLVALWVAALGFPLWISFTLFISTAINNAISRGRRGVVLALSAFGGGALLGGAPTGYALASAPVHDAWVTALCVFGLSWYLLGIGHVAYARALALRATREQLKQGETALQHANETLRARLEDIHALQAQLKDQANRDPLTGLYNRRYLQDTMARELTRCQREALPLAVMLIDIDNFKQVNDRYGHQAGDETLRQLAQLLAGEARGEDVVCRYGGEEFLVLLPGMPGVAALERAERWRRAFSAIELWSGGGRIALSLSVGLAFFPQHGRSAEELVRAADLALYRAKAAGRNRSAVFDEAAGEG